jgi:hypothetical protein
MPKRVCYNKDNQKKKRWDWAFLLGRYPDDPPNIGTSGCALLLCAILDQAQKDLACKDQEVHAEEWPEIQQDAQEFFTDPAVNSFYKVFFGVELPRQFDYYRS